VNHRPTINLCELVTQKQLTHEHSKRSTMASDLEYWIYHERQVALLCGQHALNNLVQAFVFSPDSLSDIAHQLDQMELTFMAQNNEGGTR
jgi:hypothetical protein